MVIRPADPHRDLAAITAIYGHHVAHGTGTFEEVPPTASDMAERIERILARGWPWLVAEREGAVVGYAYAGQYRDRSAYRFAGEDAVYVRPDQLGRGVGLALLSALLDAARTAGFRRMVAVIGDAANAGSIALHRRAGFVAAGRLSAVGFKFDRWLDVVLMEMSLA